MLDVGLQYSLTIIMKVNNNDIDYLCGGTVQGFKIGFHSPMDIPRELKKFVQLSPRQAALYVIEPKLTVATNETRDYEAHERRCFFSHEHKLRFFQQYTQSNCEMECLSNYSLAQCDCVHFSMLRMWIFFVLFSKSVNFYNIFKKFRCKRHKSMWNSKVVVLAWSRKFLLSQRRFPQMRLFTIVYNAHLWRLFINDWFRFCQHPIEVKPSWEYRFGKVRVLHLQPGK